jgi:hypothetical protein
MIQIRLPASREPQVWTTKNRGRYHQSRWRHPSDMTDKEWRLVEPLMPSAKRGDDKRTVNIRDVINGVT